MNTLTAMIDWENQPNPKRILGLRPLHLAEHRYLHTAAPLKAEVRAQFDGAGIQVVRHKRLTKSKNGCDIRIVVDAMRLADTFEELFIFSGDSDFVPLIDHLEEQGKTVWLRTPTDQGGTARLLNSRPVHQATALVAALASWHLRSKPLGDSIERIKNRLRNELGRPVHITSKQLLAASPQIRRSRTWMDVLHHASLPDPGRALRQAPLLWKLQLRTGLWLDPDRIQAALAALSKPSPGEKLKTGLAWNARFAVDFGVDLDKLRSMLSGARDRTAAELEKTLRTRIEEALGQAMNDRDRAELASWFDADADAEADANTDTAILRLFA